MSVISNLKVKFSADTKQFTSDVKEGEKAMKEFSQQGGDAIGNLSDMIGVDLDRISGGFSTFKSVLTNVSAGFKGAAAGSTTLTGGLKILKVALITTGIGALVVGLVSLVAYFTKSERGADKLSTMMAGLGAIVKVLTDKAVKLGEFIVSAFENPKKSIADLWNFLKDNFLNRFSGILDLFSAVGDGLKAIFDADWDALKKSATDALQSIVQINTGLDKAQQKAIIDGISNMASEMANEAVQAANLKDRLNNLETAERNLSVTSKQREAAIKSLKQVTDDITKSDQERVDAALKAKEIQRSMLNDERKIASQRIAILEEQMRLSEVTAEDQQRLADAKIALAEVDARIIDQMTEMNNKLNSLNKEIIARRVEQDKYLQLLNNPEMKRGQYGVNITMGIDTKKLAKMKNDIVAISDEIKTVMIDMTSVINDSFADVATGIGQTLGNVMAGTGQMSDFASVMLTILADMAIKVGEMAIATGIAVIGIKAALMSMNPYAAIAAGIALVALGSAVKSGLQSAASGGGGSTASSGVTSSSVRSVTASDTNNEIKVSGEFKIQGNTLVAAVNNETKRKSITS